MAAAGVFPGEAYVEPGMRTEEFSSLMKHRVIEILLVASHYDAFILEDVDCGGCIADFNGDGEVNTLDVLSFLNAWNAGDGSADVNGDGNVNTQDVLLFLNLWNAGC